MKILMWLCCLGVTLWPHWAAAQISLKPQAAIEKIPLDGREAKDFLVAGWVIVSEAEGDLNGEGRPDLAIALGLNDDMREMLDNTDDRCEAPPYIILVLLQGRNGGYERFAANGHLYPSCENALPDLKISKGVLVTNQNYRDGWALDITYRFRYDPDAHRLMLIGFDYENYSRSRIDTGVKSSENYLVGQRTEYAKNPDDRYKGKKVYGYRETSRKKIERIRISFEETKFREADSDTDQVRPF